MIAKLALIGTILALNIADWALTSYGLNGGGQEVNPIMKAVFESSHFNALLVKVGIVILAGVIFMSIKEDRYVMPALWFSVALYGTVVAWNVVQVARSGLVDW